MKNNNFHLLPNIICALQFLRQYRTLLFQYCIVLLIQHIIISTRSFTVISVTPINMSCNVSNCLYCSGLVCQWFALAWEYFFQISYHPFAISQFFQSPNVSTLVRNTLLAAIQGATCHNLGQNFGKMFDNILSKMKLERVKLRVKLLGVSLLVLSV